MADQNKNWRAIREQRPLNETRVAMYRRLMDAEERLDALRRRRGVKETAFGESLEASEEGVAPDVYLATVARSRGGSWGSPRSPGGVPRGDDHALAEPAAK